MLVHTRSTSTGYDGLSVANVLVERFAFHADKRFEMSSGSSAAGAGIEQVAIDDYVSGTWSLESVNANEAVVHVSSSGQALVIPMTMSNGQLFLLGEPVAAYTM